MSLEQMFPVQKTGFPFENTRPRMPSDLIVHGVAQYRGRQQYGNAGEIVQIPRSGHGTRRKQQGVAGQKGCHHQARFAEDDKEQNGEQPGSVGFNQSEQMYVDVQDEGNGLFKKGCVGHEDS